MLKYFFYILVLFTPIQLLYAQEGLIINEIMANPNGNSISEFEFIELYNNSSISLNLNNYYLQINNNILSLNNAKIAPKQYLIITSQEAELSLSPYGNIFISNKWYALTNSSATIKITHNNTILDQVTYYNNWHTSSQKRNGGWSLERINPQWLCSTPDNWSSCIHPMGATPGKINSVLDQHLLPKLSISDVEISTSSINLHLNTEISKLGNLSLENFELIPTIGKPHEIIIDPVNNSIKLNFKEEIVKNTLYTLEIKNIFICNLPIEATKLNIFEQSKMQANNILINEILFNPKPTGEDFVELYNNSNFLINLQNWKINNQIISTTALLLEPQDFIVITVNKKSLTQLYPNAAEDHIYQISSLPSYPNQQGTVTLFSDKSLLIDSLYYQADMHDNILMNVEGISLERQSYLSPTNTDGNFKSAATITGGATPGYQNSKNIENILKKNKIFLSSKIFDLNSLSNNVFLELNYEFIDPNNIASVTIYDINGRIIKRLIRQQTIGQQGKITWNGKNENEQIIAKGHYILNMETYSTHGQKQQYKLAFVATTLH